MAGVTHVITWRPGPRLGGTKEGLLDQREVVVEVVVQQVVVNVCPEYILHDLLDRI